MFAVLAKLALIGALSGTLFTMCERGPVPQGCCQSGDRLDVVMGNSPGWQTRCLNMGGEPHFDTATGIAWCLDVDF